MSVSDDRQDQLISEARELLVFYRANDQRLAVTLFAEDYDFLTKRKKIVKLRAGDYLDVDIQVIRGERKKKRRKRRPKDSLF